MGTMLRLLFCLLPALPYSTEDSAPSSGVLLLKISSFQNPEGRDAAGSCCNAGSSESGGVCSQPCFTMLRVCATKVENESVVVVHGSGPDRIYTIPTVQLRKPEGLQGSPTPPLPPPPPPPSFNPPAPGNVRREGSEGILHDILNLFPGAQAAPERPPERAPEPIPVRKPPRTPRPQIDGGRNDYLDMRRPPSGGRPFPRTPPPREWPRTPSFQRVDPALNIRRNGRPRPTEEYPEAGPPSPPQRLQYENTQWNNVEYSVLWRQERALFKPSTECAFGSLTTEVLFNNSIEGQGDLLVKLPFQAGWGGVVHLTVEAWHVHKPKRMPRPIEPKSAEKSVFALILERLSNQLQASKNDTKANSTTTANSTLTANSTAEPTAESTTASLEAESSRDTTTTTAAAPGSPSESPVETTTTTFTTTSDVKEQDPETSVQAGKGNTTEGHEEAMRLDTVEDLMRQGKLIMRMERNHLLYAGDDWLPSYYITYHSRMDYSLKLVCAHNYTGSSCAVTKICANKPLQSTREYYCSPSGQVVCREGWRGELCEDPICAPGCHPTQGFCNAPGECKCRSGYYGDTCSECSRLPGCQHGYCNKSYECLCREGFTGIFCSKPLCRPGCHEDNGFCKRGGECVCRAGWAGENCTECTTAPGCKHGSCIKPLECNCHANYTGEQCDRPVCAAGCHPEHGHCNQPGECVCRLGWEGEGCRTCSPYPGCQNGVCQGPWECNCLPGWKGKLCDEVETEEFTNPTREGRCKPPGSFRCMNGGLDVCVYDAEGGQVGAPVCRCRDGYGGKYCQQSTLV